MMTAADYAQLNLIELCKMLGIDFNAPSWREKILPFVPVWVAMIQASSADYLKAVDSGIVEGVGPNHISWALNTQLR